jgi:SAM-dependent methyltransferase
VKRTAPKESTALSPSRIGSYADRGGGGKYFIITLADKFEILEAMKILLYTGIDEFGIVFSNFSKDFSSSNKSALQNAFYTSINEVFQHEHFINNFDTLENLRRSALEGAGYFDAAYTWIYETNKRKKNIRLLEIGPGLGVMSFSLKKLLDINIDWMTIPDNEYDSNAWKENRTKNFNELVKKYSIVKHNLFVELDELKGIYDIIVMAQVMEHLIYNPVNTFKKLASILKDTGQLYICVPMEIRRYNVKNWREIPYPCELSEEEKIRRNDINAYGHFYEYTYEEALDVFNESGFECIGYKYNHPVHHFALRKDLPI